MMSKCLLSLVTLVVFAAVVSARPSSASDDHDDWFDHHVDGRSGDVLDWLDDKYDDDGYDSSSSYRDERFHLFLSISKSLRSAEYDSTSLSRLYKTFLRGVLHKRYAGGSHDFALRTFDSDDHDGSAEWEDYFDADDFHYKYDDDIKEEKAKRLFMYYLKFTAHCQAQREIERLIRHKEEKARKQYALFSELVSYVEQTRFQHEIAGKFSKFVDLTLRTKFDSFKSCFYHEHCDAYNDHDFDSYRTGEWKQCFSMEGGRDYDNDGKHFELFLKLYKSVSLISHTRDSHEIEDSFPDWDFHNYHDSDDDDDWRDTHPIFRYIGYLNKHLLHNNPWDFFGTQRSYKDQAYSKFLFFAIRAYKELKEEKEMKDRQERLEAIFSHFLRFISHQEDNNRINDAFYKFQKWQEIKDNHDRLEKFATYLNKVSQFRGSAELWSGHDELSQEFDHFFDYKQHDYNDYSSEEHDHNYLFSKHGYRKQNSHWNHEW